MVLMLPATCSATSEGQESCTNTNNEASCDMKDTSMLSVKAITNSREAKEQEEPASIKDIFQGANTDKFYRHGYHRYYETHLKPYRAVNGLRLLEIGADSGVSLGAWLKYFTSAAAVQGVAYKVDAQKAKQTACKLM